MKFDIVAVTYNSEKWLDGFFRSIEKLNYDKGQISLIVVDNASSDGTVAKLEEYKTTSTLSQVKIICNTSNQGFGRANNIGAQAGDGEFIFLLNIDTEIYMDALLRLEEYIYRATPDIVGFEMRQVPVEIRRHIDPVSLQTSWASGACFAIKRRAFEQVGGFDEDIFMYAEDIDLSWRLRASGGKLLYCPKAVVAHHGWKKADGGRFEYLQSAYAKLLLAYKYGDFQLIFSQNKEFLEVLKSPRHFDGVRKNLLKLYLKHFTQIYKFIRWRKTSPKLYAAKIYDFQSGFAPDRGQVVGFLSEEKPLVSVVVRTHKRKEVLRKTLLSLCNQIYENFEVVVVEDGENTAQEMIRNDFSQLNINYFATGEHLGRGRVGNIGIERSKGEYICFLDDDDLAYPDFLSTQVEFLLNDKTADLVLCATMAQEMDVLSTEPYCVDMGRIYPIVFDHITCMDMCVKCRIPMSGAMFKRQLYDICGGMREDIGGDEDWAMWLKFMGKGRRANRYSVDIPRALSLCNYPMDKLLCEKREEAYGKFDEIMLSDENLQFTVWGEEIKQWEKYVQNDINHLRNIGKLDDFLKNLKPLGKAKLIYHEDKENTLTALQINHYYYFLIEQYAKSE